MTKITESELIDLARSLKTRLKEGPATNPQGQQQVQQANMSPRMKPYANQLAAANTKAAPSSQTTQPNQTTQAKQWPTTPQAIKAFQAANKDREGKPLTADGVIGAKTYQALATQGYKAPAGFTVASTKPTSAPAATQTTQPGKTPAATSAAPQTQTQQNFAAAGMAGAEMRTPAEIAASQDLLSANNAGNINAGLTPDDPRWQGPKPTQTTQPAAPAAPAAPTGMTAQGDDAGNTTITRPDGSSMVVGPDGKQIMPGSNPNLPQNKGVVNTVKNAVTGQGDFQKPTGFIPQPAVQESSLDEIQRLVSLVHYR